MKLVSIERLMRLTLAMSFIASGLQVLGQQPTNIEITNSVQQSSVNRLGINLGDQSYWDSGQLLKNLIFRNPGFEGMKYRSILKCSQVTANTCTDDNNYSNQGTGFWKGGSYRILSGNSSGITGTVVASTKNPNNCAGCGQIITFDQNINAAVGDYFVVTNSFPGNGDAGWWDTTQNGASITTELNDLSPETPGKQALVLNANGSGQLAAVTSYFDSYTGRSFIQMNGSFAVTFRAKGVGGNNQLYVNVQRSTAGESPFLSQTVNLTNSWQNYTLTFTANETGSSVGTIGLALQAAGATVELDDVSLQQTNSSSSNPTAFRDDVVSTLKELNPGSIRMMAAGAALGSDLINQIQVPFARYREGFNSSGTEEDDVAYGIHEFLQLCQQVGADPWITIPTATTPQEMTAFIQYLTGNGSDQYSALRISRGQASSWTSVFNKIHIEFGNETWNGDFKGESMNYPAYPQLANQIFGTARGVSGFDASKFDLVLDGWSSAPGYTQIELSYSTQHDSVDIAPYLLYSLNDESQRLQFGAMFAEPELWSLPGGIVYQNLSYAQSAARPANLNVYEVNLGSMVGSPTQAQIDATQPSVGAGIAHADHMLQMMRLGVKYQNAFSLPQFEFLRGDGKIARLWGEVIDMGTTNRRRPQFMTQALANSVIGGTMLKTVQTGANPTWNQPLSSDGVILNGAHEIQSFAFNHNGNIGVVLFNLSQDQKLGVTLSGANAPSGSVQMSQITSANITDNNENSNTVQTTTQTLSGVSSSTTLSLPPFSMTVLTSSASAVQPPTFSVAGGTYSSAQTVSLSDSTSGATLYYTIDGSAPTTSSTVYSGPINVSSSETLNAIATLPGAPWSSIATASYVIGATSNTAAAPVFSPAQGTYTSGQTVKISDSTPGVTIYYSINGGNGSPYTGPILVTASETIQAIAITPNKNPSPEVSATYSIQAHYPVTASPGFSVKPGSYTEAQTVALKDDTTGATIYYTTDGSAPTIKSTKYTMPIRVSKTTTIKALALAVKYRTSATASATYDITIEATAAPTFSVKPGTYSTDQTVKLSDSTVGASIYFTTNGSIPTSKSTLYSSPIEVSSSTTIKAIAILKGHSDSSVVEGAYTILEATSAPTFSLKPGTYSTDQTVKLSDGTAGATIYFTTNGTTPTAKSTEYSSPIEVSASTTIKAVAILKGHSDSAVVEGAYTILEATAAPTFSVKPGSYTTMQTVKLSDATVGATIYFTTNGTTPTAKSTEYSSPIKIASSTTIKAIAMLQGHSDSAVVEGAYTILEATAAPTFSVKPGTYSTDQTVKLSDATAGASIYFTTNGTTPTAKSTEYSSPIKVSASTTIKAVAMLKGHSDSAVVEGAYTILEATAAPTFSLKAGTYSTDQTVKLSDSTVGASIYFTTNGTTPTSKSTEYSIPINVSASTTIKAVAILKGHSDSAVVEGTYTILETTAAPTFSVKPGTYSTDQTVKLSDGTAGATIYFTTNGTTPTAKSTEYGSPIKIASSTTIKAIAMLKGHSDSSVVEGAYTILVATSAPTFSVKPGSYTTMQTVKLSDGTAGATIYFTTNGTTPTSKSTEYSGPIKIASSMTIKAVAMLKEHSDSGVVEGAYTIVEATAAPTFSVNPGTYTSPQLIELKDATQGSVIHYTLDGSVPDKNSTTYTTPLRIGSSKTIKMIAVAPTHSSSTEVDGSFTIRARPRVEENALKILSLKPGT